MKTPWYFWIIGFLMLMWNGMSAMDYVLSVTRNQAYLAGFTPEHLAFLQSFPTWAVACWAMAVWTYLLGSVLFLLRSRHCAWLFQMGFAFMVVLTFHNLFLASVPAYETMSAFEMAFSAAIIILALAQYLYARSLAARGLLR